METHYLNYFKMYGHTDDEIEERLDRIYKTFFYGGEDERIYHETNDDMAYLLDTGNNDVRTEGMSYGMMMCVQRNMKKEFDKIWRWVDRYMRIRTGAYAGYFRWSVWPNGVSNSDGPAPDGEEYFAMALFFASHRWGEGEGIYAYGKQAKDILHACIHKGYEEIGESMWDRATHLIKFVPSVDFTDPSYHLPHFYELFAKWTDEGEQAFWQEAVRSSRAFLKKACHPQTGLAAEFTDYEGRPRDEEGHGKYYSDAYRVIANIGLDYGWFGSDEWESGCADRLQKFFAKCKKEDQGKVYEIDGTVIDTPALHPVAIIATNAMGALAAKGEYKKFWIEKFWQTPLRKGNRRYYDNCLYVFAFLALSGNYRIW